MMRRILINTVFLLLAFQSTNIKAQFVEAIHSNYGLSYSRLIWDYGLGYSGLSTQWGDQRAIGYFNNIDIEYGKKKIISFLSSIGYIQKGGKDPYQYNWFFNYFSLDTKIKLRYEFGDLSAFMFAGPRMDLLLQYTKDIIPLSPNIINYGANYGVGVDFSFKKTIIGLNWSNNFNLNPIINNNGENVLPRYKTWDKTMVFSIGIGYTVN